MSDKPATAYDLEQIQYPIIMAPFFGVMIPVRLRELTHAQINACGDFSLIQTFEDKIASMSKRMTEKESFEQIETMTNIVRESLVDPSYDDIIKMYDKDGKVLNAREELKKLREKVFEMPRGPQRTNLEEEIIQLRLRYEFLLPEDFVGFIWSYALGINKSDIKKLSEKMLLEAAVLADRGHDNPADHIDGIWPEMQKGFYLADINKKAWNLLDREREKHKEKKKNKKELKIG